MRLDYSQIEWDSNVFGFKVAKITEPNLDSLSLKEILLDLKTQGYRLVYWVVPSDQLNLIEIGRQHGGALVDEKVVYVKDMSKTVSREHSFPYVSSTYTGKSPDPDLISLALESGKYSRFSIDRKFPKHLFEKIYTIWITRSVLKEIAWKVLVVKLENKLLGMVTLGGQDGPGIIGLLAVSPESRGVGIGKLLVSDAENIFAERGFDSVQIATQRVNVLACKLYESCGYKKLKVNTMFHFWIS
jgi:dTDP-4-amino-4,6-dideoxy-D-galactose acyltransferase